MGGTIRVSRHNSRLARGRRARICKSIEIDTGVANPRRRSTSSVPLPQRDKCLSILSHTGRLCPTATPTGTARTTGVHAGRPTPARMRRSLSFQLHAADNHSVEAHIG